MFILSNLVHLRLQYQGLHGRRASTRACVGVNKSIYTKSKSVYIYLVTMQKDRMLRANIHVLMHWYSNWNFLLICIKKNDNCIYENKSIRTMHLPAALCSFAKSSPFLYKQ